MTRPFVEDRQYEQGELTDEFYTTGSSPTVGNDMWTFAKPLRDKETISLSFQVTSKTTMLPNSSSIYYFNHQSGSWNIPKNALVDHTGPFGQVAMRTGTNTARNLGSSFVDDTILFDYKGNANVSGSLPIFRPRSQWNLGLHQKLEEASLSWRIENVIDSNAQGRLMAMDAPKSCQRNESYKASSDEVFTLPIDRPFLLEKVVIELPICAGPNWFKDRSTLCYMTSSKGDYTLNGSPSMGDGGIEVYELLDQGGPCLTFALMCQKNYGTGSIRDLISKSTVTHDLDIVENLFGSAIYINNVTQPGDPYDTVYINAQGNKRKEIDSVVSPTNIVGTKKYFTGSVKLTATPSITNGLRIINKSYCEDYSLLNESPYVDFLNKKLGTPYLAPVSTELYPIDEFNYVPVQGFLYDEYFFLAGIDTFGRGMTGFSPSGGSIFGGEYSGIDGDKVTPNNLVKNPFYIEDETQRSLVFNYIYTNVLEFRDYSTPNLRLNAISDLFTGKKKESPYLVYPGDKLLLSISKTRPAIKTFKVDVNTSTNPNAASYGIGTPLSASYYHDLDTSVNGHDVQLNTGSINITLYGSYVRAGNSYVP